MTVYGYRYSYRYGQKPERASEEVVDDPVRWAEENETVETPGLAGHGLSAYRWRRCRCSVCRAAKAESARAYKQRIKAERHR